jgi:predicted DNA-binding transcriptional regulator AlpA
LRHRNKFVVVVIMNSQGKLAGLKQLEPTSVDPEELLDVAETAKLLRQKEATLAAWRCHGRGPQYLKIGRSIYYRRSAISTWLAGQIVTPGAASTAA